MRLFTTMLLLISILLLAIVTLLGWSRQASPQQNWLMFTTCPEADNLCDLYRLQPDIQFSQKIVRHRYGVFAEGFFNFSSLSGARLYFTDRHENGFDLYGVRVDGSGYERLTNLVGEEEFVALSPDREWLIFRQWSLDADWYRLYRMHADGSDLALISEVVRGELLEFHQWLPHKDALLISQNGFLYLVRVGSWQLEPILELNEYDSFLGITSDEQQVIVAKLEGDKAHVLAVNINTLATTLLYETDETEPVQYGRLNPTNPDEIALQITSIGGRGAESYVVLLKLDGSGAKRLTPHGHGYFEGWSPDGSRLLYYFYPFHQDYNPLPRGLYYVDIENPPPQLVVKESDISTFSLDITWSPNGDWVLLSNSQNIGEWLVSADGEGTINDLRQSLDPDSTPRGGSVWSPDGQWVILEVDSLEGNYDLYRVNSTTLQAEKLVDFPEDVFFVSWLPNIDLYWHRSELVGLVLALLSIGIGGRFIHNHEE